MLGRTLVFSGGRYDDSFVKAYLEKQSFDTVVCADSGLDAAFRYGVLVDYFMGDFDSVSSLVLEKYQKAFASESQSAQWIQYPKEKDATDTQLVLEWIVERNPSEIVILGATGGRMDHFLANLNLLMIPLREKIPTYIIDRNNKIYLTDSTVVIDVKKQYGKYISLQPLSQKVTGVTLHGMKYPLENAVMTIGTSLGVSNELAENATEAVIQVKDGILIVIESKDD